MFNQSALINELTGFLTKKEFSVYKTKGCFDIVAKKKNLLLIKSLMNVDALNKGQAMSLRSISYFLSAFPFVVSVKNNREFLHNSIVYSRFQLPVVTPKTFEDSIEEEKTFFVDSSKGKNTVEINTDLLESKRSEFDLSLRELAQIIGISKKALYEIENRRVSPSLYTVKKLENYLKIKLRKSSKLKSCVEPTYLQPKNSFQKKVSREFSRIGIDNSPIYSAPFEIVGKEKFSLITNLSDDENKIKKEVKNVKRVSRIFSTKALFVSKKQTSENVDGVPVFSESELIDIDSSKELQKILEEKSE